MMGRGKYKIKKKNIVKLETFYNKVNKEIKEKDGKRDI